MGSADRRRSDRRSSQARDWVAQTEADGQLQEPDEREQEAGDEAIKSFLGATSGRPNIRRRLWRRLRWLLAAAVVVALALPAIFWFQYHSRYITSKNAAVRGHLAEVGSRLAGLVTKVEVDVGDRVVAGQILVRMEDRHLQAEVLEARAEVQGLQRTIEVERMNIDHERRRIVQRQQEADANVAAAQAQAEAARIRADDARYDHELRETLFRRDGIISGEDVREAETDRRWAEAQFAQAAAKTEATRSEGESVRLAGDALHIKQREVGVLEAELLRAQARLTRAEADLDGASLRAPEDGAIVRRIVQPGGAVDAGQPIISMWLGDDVWVEAWVDESDIGEVDLGSRAMVTFHSFPGREFSGVVDKIGLATDLEIPDSEVPQPRFSRIKSAPVVGVRIRLDDPPADLLPGLSAVVAIRKAE